MSDVHKSKLKEHFTFLGENEYECEHLKNKVKEYRHNFTGIEFDIDLPHNVSLSPYLIGKYQCTQEQWEKVMGINPSYFKGAKNPVECISWNNCQEFCKKTELLLPTVAQWEFACRAGSKDIYCFGDGKPMLEEYAWYVENSGGKNVPNRAKETKCLWAT